MSGPVILLSASNQMDYVSERRYKSKHEQRPMDQFGGGANCTFTRDSDSFQPEYLIFKNMIETQLTNDDVEDLINKLDTFQLEIGGSIIWKNSISLFVELNKPKIINNAVCIKIPFDMFVDEIKLISLANHEVRCGIRFRSRLDEYETSICYNEIYYDNAYREQLYSTMITTPIQQINSDDFDLVQGNNRLRVNFNGLAKGYFFQGNINEIINLKMVLNGFEYFDYDQIMVNLVGTRISENLLFLPFSPSVNMKEITHQSYMTGINHSRIDTVECAIRSAIPQTNFVIHALEYNELNYSNGMIGVGIGMSRNNIFTPNAQPAQPSIVQTPTIIQQHPVVTGWTNRNRIIDLTKNSECPITYVEFIPNCNYCKCATCRYNFDTPSLQRYFDTINTRTCPMCRGGWTDFTIYKNMAEEIAEN